MIIVDDLWLKSAEFLTQPVANTFKIVIQLGSILASVIVFKDRFIDILGLNRFFHKEKIYKRGEGHLNLLHVIVGIIPAGILGVLFNDYIDEHLFFSQTVAIGLILGAILMIFADLYSRKHKPTIDSLDEITYKHAFIVGLIQCFSLWPGFSRSGATISGGVLTGLNHRTAADFTFIMAVPIMAGASFISLLDNLQYFTLDAMPFFITGFVSAFIFALVSIRFFLKLINKIKLVPFAIYRIIVAILILVLYI